MNNPTEDPLRPHTYDGIQEYDKRLPNWWLVTLWGAVAFSVVYWFYYHEFDLGGDPAINVVHEIDARKKEIARASEVLDDAKLWKMSRDSAVVAAGKNIYMDATKCVICHLPEMQGNGVAPNLADNVWLHGGEPMKVMRVISEGVLEKGMLAWKTQLTPKQIAEVTAFILSKHEAPQ
jgi:cytochrome c oxidase cbb3-type subunit III